MRVVLGTSHTSPILFLFRRERSCCAHTQLEFSIAASREFRYHIWCPSKSVTMLDALASQLMLALYIEPCCWWHHSSYIHPLKQWHRYNNPKEEEEEEEFFYGFDFLCCTSRLAPGSDVLPGCFGERVLVAPDEKTDGRNWFHLTFNTPGFYTFVFQEFLNKHWDFSIRNLQRIIQCFKNSSQGVNNSFFLRSPHLNVEDYPGNGPASQLTTHVIRASDGYHYNWIVFFFFYDGPHLVVKHTSR